MDLHERLTVLHTVLVREAADVLATLRMVPILRGVAALFPQSAAGQCQRCVMAGRLHRGRLAAQRYHRRNLRPNSQFATDEATADQGASSKEANGSRQGCKGLVKRDSQGLTASTA